MFFIQGECHVPELLTKLDCNLTSKGTVETYNYEKTNVPGLYVAGDASRRVQFAIVAAAEGAMAAFAINNELTDEDLKKVGHGMSADDDGSGSTCPQHCCLVAPIGRNLAPSFRACQGMPWNP